MARPAPPARVTSPIYRPPSGGRRTAPAGPNPARVAGVLLLTSAAFRIVEHTVLSRWVQIESSSGTVYTYAAIAAGLGLALIQGSDGARRAALWLNALGLFGGLALALAAFALPDLRAALPLALLVILGGVALVGILAGTPSSGRVFACAALFVLALAGQLAASVWLLEGGARELRSEIAEWAAPEREFKDAEAGLRVALPEGWVFLKPGNPYVDTVGTKMALGQETVGALAAVYEESGHTYLSVDDYLDQWYADRKTRLEDMKQLARRDVTVGKANGRQMTLSWSTHSLRFLGALSAWKDGRHYFALLSFTTGGLASRAEPEIARLEKALVFDAPVAAHVKEAVTRVTAACALLSAGAVEAMSRTLPRDATTELYCRRGYEWAARGVREMGGGAPATMGALTSKLFGALNPADRERLGRYLEKVQAGANTSMAEERAGNEMLSRGFAALSDGEKVELRGLVEAAIELGRLS